MENNEFYTVEQISTLLKVHWQTVLNYIKSGKLTAVKLGKGYRVSGESLKDFLTKQQTTIPTKNRDSEKML